MWVQSLFLPVARRMLKAALVDPQPQPHIEKLRLAADKFAQHQPSSSSSILPNVLKDTDIDAETFRWQTSPQKQTNLKTIFALPGLFFV